MIVEWAAQICMDLAVFFAGLFPEWEIPEFMTSGDGWLGVMAESLYGLGVWVDWGALGICLTAVGGVYVVAGLIKLARAVIAHLPMVGGAG